MQMQLETEGATRILAYRPGELRLRDASYDQSIALATRAIHVPWQHGRVAELTLQQLEPVLALGCDILILGTGERQRMPPPLLYAGLAQRGAGLEVMDNPAACRTFNVLLSEGRSVALALMQELR